MQISLIKAENNEQFDMKLLLKTIGVTLGVDET